MLLGEAIWCRLLGIQSFADENSSAVLTIVDAPVEKNNLSGSRPCLTKAELHKEQVQFPVQRPWSSCRWCPIEPIPWIELSQLPSLLFLRCPDPMRYSNIAIIISCLLGSPLSSKQIIWNDMTLHANAWFQFMWTCQNYLDGDQS